MPASCMSHYNNNSGWAFYKICLLSLQWHEKRCHSIKRTVKYGIVPIHFLTNWCIAYLCCPIYFYVVQGHQQAPNCFNWF
ncbi:hypothetical protein XENTR_v10009027 [Xenopus tropicalis]|nr:hypothetical protein XENTR_v10009027 [Xenopus tropicalis]